ncbi:MAG: sigma 54-interacting transcriptional regulator [Kofleriaceae bacterium]
MDQTTTVEPRSVSVATGTLRVEATAGPSRGAATLFDADTITVGSADGNTLVIADPLVSRFHLELVRTPDAIRVTDLGSTNGTYVGTTRVTLAEIQPGTVLRIGATELRISAGRMMRVDLLAGDELTGLRGTSQVMRRLLATIQRVAPGPSSILITGESGTGKEVTATTIHALGPRPGGAFVTVDCGAMAPQLVASELFGHERGAFTGADRQHLGAFERAHGGTLFLDEIGELSLEVQAALLGVLERRRFRRVGGSADLAVDVRVIAATHRDLRAEVNAGRFRLDLYYRLAVVVLTIPPLRERTDDIVPLVEHFLGELGARRTAAEVFGHDGLAALVRHSWPGNVRELRNAVESALVLGPAAAATAATAAAPGGADPDLDLPYKQARAEVTARFERGYLVRLLERADGNVSKAARMSQMDRSHLIELIRKHRLRGDG